MGGEVKAPPTPEQDLSSNSGRVEIPINISVLVLRPLRQTNLPSNVISAVGAGKSNSSFHS